MEIIVPEPTELDTKTRRKVTTTAPSFGQTLSSQYSRIIDPIANQNKFYTSTSGDYDPDSIPRVEEFIVKQNLGDEDARYLRTFGIGNLLLLFLMLGLLLLPSLVKLQAIVGLHRQVIKDSL